MIKNGMNEVEDNNLKVHMDDIYKARKAAGDSNIRVSLEEFTDEEITIKILVGDKDPVYDKVNRSSLMV